MIRLSETKIDELYNIDDNGIITDLNGNIQKTFISKNREYFKQQQIHRILMWTKFGYRDTKIWIIHHIDKNPLNNNINNLIFLTRAKHAQLHTTNKHWNLSKETRRKISNNQKGRIPWNKGKHNVYSEETKKKMSVCKKGRIPWNKGKKKGIDF